MKFYPCMWIFTICLLLSLIPADGIADEAISGIDITSAKDALNLISHDNFGPVSLKRLRDDIDNKRIYNYTKKYGTVSVEVASQYSLIRYGSVDFSFFGDKAELNITPDEIKQYFEKQGISPKKSDEHTLSFFWKSNGFSCMCDYNQELGLFEYLCHYKEDN
jgi:hypothetical protein